MTFNFFLVPKKPTSDVSMNRSDVFSFLNLQIDALRNFKLTLKCPSHLQQMKYVFYIFLDNGENELFVSSSSKYSKVLNTTFY